MYALQKQTVRFEELRDALEYCEDVKTELVRRDSHVRRAMEEDKEAQGEIERAGCAGVLFYHAFNLRLESEEHLNRQRRTLEIVWPVRPDEDAEHTRWDDLERKKKYRGYVVPINLIIEKDGLMDFVAPPRHLFIWCAAPKL